MDLQHQQSIGQPDDRQQIEIFDMDVFSKSDPQVILYMKNKGNNQWREVGRTEIIYDNLNPNFVKTFIVDYIFEIQQHVKFEVIDIDGPNKFEFIGSIETTISALVGAKNQTSVLQLVDDKQKKSGKLILRCDTVNTSSETIRLKLSAKNVKNTHWLFSKSSPFLKFYRYKEAINSNFLVYQTEVVNSSLSPAWNEFSINLGKLCNGDILLPVKIELWDHRSNGSHILLGDTEITVDQLKNQQIKKFNFKDIQSKGVTGTLFIDKCTIDFKPQFIDYIKGGTQLELVIAIDFTASNGFPHLKESLHSYAQGSNNLYQKAIRSVGEILINYDYDKLIPVYGFGGKPKFPQLTSHQTMHCFPLTGDVNNSNVYEIKGVLDTYDYALHNSELSGPTHFSPIIKETMKICQQHKDQDEDNYVILLILTDGEIHDMEQTKTCLVDSSHLPLSIIIVGIGNADFTNMDILDGDDGLWDSRGRKAQRDLVQFVPFKDFQGDPVELAKHVLEELPDQLTYYMQLVKKQPKPALKVNINSMYDIHTEKTLSRQGTFQKGNFQRAETYTNIQQQDFQENNAGQGINMPMSIKIQHHQQFQQNQNQNPKQFMNQNLQQQQQQIQQGQGLMENPKPIGLGNSLNQEQNMYNYPPQQQQQQVYNNNNYFGQQQPQLSNNTMKFGMNFMQGMMNQQYQQQQQQFNPQQQMGPQGQQGFQYFFNAQK